MSWTQIEFYRIYGIQISFLIKMINKLKNLKTKLFFIEPKNSNKKIVYENSCADF